MRKLMLFEGSEAGFLLENIKSRAFSPFSKQLRKNNAKRNLKSHCRRRALTAAPLGETGESRLDGLTVLETAKTANEPKS